MIFPARRRIAQFVGLTSLLLAALAIAVRLSTWQGLVRPVRILSGSMADSLLGSHRRLDCHECRFSIRFDARNLPETGRAVCSNCGYTDNQIEGSHLLPGERVLIDRLSYLYRSPRRWEAAAYRDPHVPGRLAVKRIVGLPKERIEIRRGNVLVDGRMARKDLAQQREMALLVHDSRYELKGDPRWIGEQENSDWSPFGGGYRYRRRKESRDLDWLVYHHRLCFAGPRNRVESPILDNYGYNQGVSRNLHRSTELMVSCELDLAAIEGKLAFLIDLGLHQSKVVLDLSSGQFGVFGKGQMTRWYEIPASFSAGRHRIEFSLFDQQLLFAVDSTVWLSRPLEPFPAACQPPSRPIAVGCSGSDVTVGRLRVWRDVQYTGEIPQKENWLMETSLGNDEYLLLGDNSPISQDSRHWELPAIRRGSLLGNVVKRGGG